MIKRCPVSKFFACFLAALAGAAATVVIASFLPRGHRGRRRIQRRRPWHRTRIEAEAPEWQRDEVRS